MNQKRKRHRDSAEAREFWLAKVALYDTSGLTHREFCALHGLNVSTFRSRLAEFRNRGETYATVAGVSGIKQPEMLKVRLIKKDSTNNEHRKHVVEVRTPNGFVFIVNVVGIAESTELIRELSLC